VAACPARPNQIKQARPKTFQTERNVRQALSAKGGPGWRRFIACGIATPVVRSRKWGHVGRERVTFTIFMLALNGRSVSLPQSTTGPEDAAGLSAAI